VILELINGQRVEAHGTAPSRRIRIDGTGAIESLDGPAGGGPDRMTVALPPEALVLPGLINAHDHLIGTFQPRVGFGPYLNWLQWDNDLKRSAVFRQRNMIDAGTIYHLGALKSILSGVTTVADHIPRHISDPQRDRMPVRMVAPYCLSHSVASFRLQWGDGSAIEYARAHREGLPFMVHVGEGYDPETRGELAELDRQQALGPQTLLVHGVAFTPADAELAGRRGASLAWCPGSNLFMFGRTGDVRELRRAGVNVCLGTDSLFTGTSGLLEEIRMARACYNERYGEELPARDLFAMVTVNAARALHLEPTAGTIESGGRADLLCLEARGLQRDPYEALIAARTDDILLLLCNGRPLLGRPEFREIFEATGAPFRRIRLKNGGGQRSAERLVVGDPAGLLDRVRARLGFRKELPFLLGPESGSAGD